MVNDSWECWLQLDREKSKTNVKTRIKFNMIKFFIFELIVHGFLCFVKLEDLRLL